MCVGGGGLTQKTGRPPVLCISCLLCLKHPPRARYPGQCRKEVPLSLWGSNSSRGDIPAHNMSGGQPGAGVGVDQETSAGKALPRPP